jgi:hypothetical protein
MNLGLPQLSSYSKIGEASPHYATRGLFQRFST